MGQGLVYGGLPNGESALQLSNFHGFVVRGIYETAMEYLKFEEGE